MASFEQEAAIKFFEADLQKFADKMGLSLEKVAKNVAVKAYEGVSMKTPRDTGWAKNNWNMTVDVVDSSVKPKGQYPGEPTVPLGNLVGYKAGELIYITNNVEYIVYLEDGHSAQAPFGMVSLTINELRTLIGSLV